MPQTITYKIAVDNDGYQDVYDGADKIKDIIICCGVDFERVQCFPGEKEFTYILDLPSDNVEPEGDVYSSLKEKIDGLKYIREMKVDTEIPDEKLKRLDDSSP